MFGQLQDSIAQQQALTFDEMFKEGDAPGVISLLLGYTQSPSPLETFGDIQEASNAGKLLQAIKSALGIVLIHHTGLSRNPEIRITSEEAERLLQDPIFQQLRKQVKALSETSNLSLEDLKLVTW